MYSHERVVITGASSGVATAEAFAERGAQLSLAARSDDGLATVAVRCRMIGGEATILPTDTTAVNAVTALVERARVLLGGIDHVVQQCRPGRDGALS